jgi:hypothetical protein
LIVRRLHMDTVLPRSAVDNKLVTEFSACIVESDMLCTLDTLSADVDLEVDVSPFIQGTSDILDSQAEIFIGIQVDANGWTDKGKSVDRVPVSLLNSSNQLFADYVIHNGNVFSWLDRFEYGPKNSLKLTDATASYYVLGWHSNDDIGHDVFNITLSDNTGKNPISISTNPSNTTSTGPSRGSRFDGCNMTFPDGAITDDALKTWRSNTVSARTLCHGAMYGVTYSYTNAPQSSGANDIAKLFQATSPITVGTTPLDAVLAFVDAHVNDASFADEQAYLKDLQALEPLLLVQEENVDSQFEAADMLSDHNFAPSADTDGHWHLSGENSEGKPTQPTATQLTDLKFLNDIQEAYDQGVRELKKKRWDLWSMWWQQASTTSNNLTASEVTNLSASITKLNAQLQTWKSTIDTNSTQKTLPVKKGARDRFYSLRDPSILISGITSPWPADYQDALKTRLPAHIVPYNAPTPGSYSGWTGYPDQINSWIKVFPTTDLSSVATSLLLEFFMLHPPDSSKDNWKPTTSTTGIFFPLYHDPGPNGDPTKLRDNWNNTQPWFPIFVEWVAEYFHIQPEDWAFEKVNVPNATPKYRYGIQDGITVGKGDTTDKLTIQGRILILPQPTFSLANKIKQLWDSLSPDQQTAISSKFVAGTTIESLMQAVQSLPFMSSPLSGFTTQLITQLQGTHLKPTRRIPGSKVAALLPAANPTLGFTSDVIVNMDVQTNTTPYAEDVEFPTKWNHSPFKPVTHGQLRFTKLNIIDKFGQAVSAIDPRPGQAQPLIPVVSEYYRTQLLSDGKTPNTIISSTDSNSQFIQVPPNINQDARLNGVFLTRDAPKTSLTQPPWRPALEWESPIWGWVVVNYIESGVQLFLPNGEFYREVRLGGVSGDTKEPKWKPFDPPPSLAADTDPEFILPIAQLNALLTKLGDRTYLTAFINMINQAMDSLPYAPNEYADYMSAIIGKPLALVNTGWSLELSTEPLQNQSMLAPASPDHMLLDYKFSLMLGDPDRVYDGIVGFFKGSNDPPGTAGTGPVVGQELDLTSLYTYFPAGGPTKDLSGESKTDLSGGATANTTTNGPAFSLKPYHIGIATTDGSAPTTDPDSLRQQHDAQFQVISAIMDPFTAIHGYCGILPIKPLSIPPWTVQTALKSMAAFFTIGPLVVPRTVDTYSKDLRLDMNTDEAAMQKIQSGNVPAGTGIPIPAASSADWLWLQPFYVSTPDVKSMVTEFNPVGIEPVGVTPKFEPPPYVAVEGYLQMRLGSGTSSGTTSG